MNIFDTILKPQSIAVIGVSRSPEKVGYQILNNIIQSKFPGKIYPINPNATSILSLKTYPTISELPQPPNLAIIVTPASIVPIVLEETALKKVPAAIIITAGFSESGSKGRRLQNKIFSIAQKHPIRVLGPNCLGILNTNYPLNATFGPPLPQTGSIMLISQSGAIVTGILDWAKHHQFGLSHAITFGNRIDVNENEALQFAAKDPNIKYILVYLESFSNAPRFFSLASVISKKKPIILLKGGQSSAGQSASASHTAALATDFSLIKALSYQTGVILSENYHQWLNTAALFTQTKPICGLDLAIITNAGGPGVISTDEAVSSGLHIVPVTSKTRHVLENALRLHHPNNPIDILGDALPQDFQKALRIVDKDSVQDALLVIITPQTTTKPLETAKIIINHSKSSNKPLYVVLIGGEKISSARKVLERAGIPVFAYPKFAIDLISSRAKYHHYLKDIKHFPAPSVSTVKSSAIKKI